VTVKENCMPSGFFLFSSVVLGRSPPSVFWGGGGGGGGPDPEATIHVIKNVIGITVT
jgi:hypothetical protein